MLFATELHQLASAGWSQWAEAANEWVVGYQDYQGHSCENSTAFSTIKHSVHQQSANLSANCGNATQQLFISNDQETGNDNLYGFISSGTWHIVRKLPYLFYLVWPTETMFPSLDQVPRYVTEMFPVFFVAAIMENLIRMLQGRSSIRVNESVGSMSQGIFQECLRIKVRSIEVLVYCLIWNNFRLVALPWDSLWTWWLCYLAVDLGFYYAHRLAHEVNFIWAIHQAHHSSEEFSIVSALRQAVLQPFTAWFTYLPLALFIPPQVFLAHLQLSELYMAWLHTEIVDTIGPLEYILNTPSHHRVHHSRNPEYIDKNYGGMLIIWDRLLGTFKAEDKNNPPVYGLVHPVRTFNPIRVQFHPWPVIWRRLKRAKTLEHKLGVLFYRPGWRPGVARPGHLENIPKLAQPVTVYDPPVSSWKKLYVVIHFGLLLFFYHELTLYQHTFRALVLNVGVLSLLASITSLGLMLDDKRRYCAVYELARCLAFFQARQHLGTVVEHGLGRTGLIQAHRMLVISLVHKLFAMSILLILAELLRRLLCDHQQDISKRGRAVYNYISKLPASVQKILDTSLFKHNHRNE